MGVRVAKSERKSEHSDRLGSRFAIGAASIGAVCAAMAPFRAVPWIGAQVASRMIRSKVWWYGSYEALKAAAATEFKSGSRSAPGLPTARTAEVSGSGGWRARATR